MSVLIATLLLLAPFCVGFVVGLIAGAWLESL